MATKDVKTERPKVGFAFGKKNYLILIAGILLLIIGFIALSGGGSDDPNKFSYALFSTRRMVIAPLLLMLGFVTVGVAIMIKPDKEQPEGESNS